MEWTEDLSVGVDLIDEQHKELFRRINDLVKSIKNHACKFTIGETIGFLEEYAERHFAEEEKYMVMYDYPEYDLHRKQHKVFLSNCLELKKELAGLEGGGRPGSYELSVETNRVVVDWIAQHIFTVDRKLGAYLRARILI
ncbi:MAG: hemerythrin family protein [Nitrospirae bacterium]|nr:hemerythrin family protein [Nitrospirota bacterium]